MNLELAATLRPVSEPKVIDNVYTQEQLDRVVAVIRREGPWKAIIAQHFASPEELVATLTGARSNSDKPPSFDDFLTANFRGYLAEGGLCFYPELEDVFYNQAFLDHVRGYWGVEYAQPTLMLFNIQGPSESHDTAHIDGTSYRGIVHENTPIWLMNLMVKTGLFNRWQKKMAQVITWFYQGNIGGGFTYWPEGPHLQPKRVPAPMWNRGVIVQNEMMYHRGESNGPVERRHPEGLAFHSLFEADPDRSDGWQITTDGKVIQKIPAEEFRLLIHWGCEVFMDDEELKLTLDHTDDLTHDRVFDMIIADLRERGETFEMPSDPLTDQKFIGLMTRVYDLGKPTHYPPEPEELAA